MKTLEIYQSPKNRMLYWRLRARNGQIVGNGAGDGYKRARSLFKGIASMFGISPPPTNYAEMRYQLSAARRDIKPLEQWSHTPK